MDNTTVPLRHSFDEPTEYQAFRLSPSGTRLGRLVPSGEGLNLEVEDLASGGSFSSTRFNDTHIAAWTWASDDRLLFSAGEARALFAVDIDGGRGRNLNPDGRLLRVIHRLPLDPDRVLVAQALSGDRGSEVYSLSLGLTRPALRRIMQGPPAPWPDTWLLEADGTVRGAVVTDGDQEQLWTHGEAGWRLLTTQSRWQPEWRWLAGTLESEAVLAVHWPAGQSGAVLRRYNLRDGSAGEPLETLSDGQCCRLLADPQSGALLGLFSGDSRTESDVWLNTSVDGWQSKMNRDGVTSPRLLSVDGGAGQALVATGPRLSRPDYLLVNLVSGESRRLDLHPDGLAAIARAHRQWLRDIPLQADRRGFALDMGAPGPAAVPTQPQVDRTGLTGSGGNP